MKFFQNEDGSCKIKFTDEEIKVLNEKKELFMSAEVVNDFGNILVKIVGDLKAKLHPEIATRCTEPDDS